MVLAGSLSGFAAEPDKPGTKLITVQGGYGPGIGAIVSGNIAMASCSSVWWPPIGCKYPSWRCDRRQKDGSLCRAAPDVGL